jgi:branched-chain amino acid transport system substrate-binding protein
MQVRPTLGWITFSLCAIVLIAGCKKPGQQGGPQNQPGQPLVGNTTDTGAGDIVIGHYASKTGSEANFGISTDNGVMMAVEERNGKGGVKGRQIKLITYDDAGKPDEVKNVVGRLIKQNKAIAILGEVASGLSQAGGQICQKEGVPMITPSSTNPKVTQIGPFISRVCFIDTFQGAAGAKFVKEKLGFASGATLFNRGQEYATGLNDGFVTAFQGIGGKITHQAAYNTGDPDFTAQLNAIKATNPQFVYIPTYYTEVVAIAKQARQIGLNVPLIGGDGWVSESLADARGALDDCYFTDHYSDEEDRPEVKEFVRKYQAKYNKVPDSMAALGYDAANVLFDAMERAPSLHGGPLATAINATKDFKGVTGNITLDANRDVQKRAVVQKLKDGKFSLFWTVEPGK